MGQRAGIGVFKLTTQGHSMGDPRLCYRRIARTLADVLGRRLPLDGGIRRENDLVDSACGESVAQRVQAELLGTNAVDGRQMPHQHVVVPLKTAALLDRHDIYRRLHHTQQAGIALAIRANLADVQLGEIPALLAVLDLGQHPFDRLSDLLRALAIPLKQV